MIAWFTRNPVAANLLLASIVLAGLFSIIRLLPLEVFPEFEVDMVRISVTQRAATPQDMEIGVASRIEEAIADLPYIKELTSQSQEQSTQVFAELDNGTDLQKALNEIKSRVDALSTLPVDAERPVIELPIRKREVISVAVAGDLDEKELNLIARQVRDDLLRQPLISQTDIEGIRPYEISISVPEHQLRRHNLTLAEISSAINGQALDLSAGTLRSDSGEILLRAKAQAYHFNAFDNIVLRRNADGSTLKLGDIAAIDDGFEEDPIAVRFNGKPAAMVNVYRVGNDSAIAVAEAVKEYIRDNRHRYPASVSLGVWDDSSRIVKARLTTLLSSAWQGGLLVMILLTLFLRPIIALWVVVGIPVTFLGAFALMPYLGLTINILSLFGFILVLGIVVDDAIVTGENVYSHFCRHPDGLQAAIKGTEEVSTPVVFGILTTVAAFLPLTIMEGSAGMLMQQIAWVVIPVLLFSLIESKLILPAHLRYMKPIDAQRAKKNLLFRIQGVVARALDRFIQRVYRPLLSRAMHHRYLTVLGFIAMMLITVSLLLTGWSRFVYFPRIQSEKATASLVMQQGTPLAITEAVIKRIEDAAFELQRLHKNADSGDSVIINVIAMVGASGGNVSGRSNVGRVRFEITAPEQRSSEVTSSELVAQWRAMIGPIAGVDSLTFRAEIGRSSEPVDIQLSSDDTASLAAMTNLIRDKLELYQGVFDISDTLSDGKQELHIELKPEAELLGFNLQQVSVQVREAFYGSQAQRIQRGRDDVRVMVRYPLQQRQALADLDNLLIRSTDGAELRFADIATVSWDRAPSSIYHVDRQRAVNVQADIDKQNVNMSALSADLSRYLDVLMLEYPNVQYSLEGEASDQRESFDALLWGLVFVIFAIYALLAIPFGSYSQPFIVMSVIPFAVVGAIGGHWLMGVNMTILSIMGMLALVGIVVNDSLVLVDYSNKRIKEGDTVWQAVSMAGVARFRPVLLTSLTTFLGLLPLMFEKSTQAQFLIPMAISLAFGILFATFITLLLIPCHYLILQDVGNVFSTLKRRELCTEKAIES